MSSNVLGGGILFAAIAVLWVIVLVPSLIRGRQFRAAEQNAARLQRTLRLLAETAEVPEEHRLEATAREALAHERKLKQARRHQEVSRKQDLQAMRTQHRIEQMKTRRELAQMQTILKQERLRSAKLKPVRLIAAVMALLGAGGLLVGLGLMIAGMGAVTVWVSLAALALGAATLVRLAPGASKQQAEAVVAVSEPIKQSMPKFDNSEEPAEAPRVKDAATHAAAQAKAQQELMRARVLAEARAQARAAAVEARKDNQPGSMLLSESVAEASRQEAAKPSTKKEVAASNAGTPSQNQAHNQELPKASVNDRLKKMGVIEDAPIADLDEMLKRRRQAG